MRDTRQQIIDLAYEKFLSVGFSKVSMDSLVEELHISKSTLYKYFPSKDDLLIEVIHKYTGGVDKMFLGFLEDPELEIMDKFVAFTEAYGNGLQQLSDAFIRDLQLFAPAIWASEVIARDRRFAALFGRLHDMAVGKGLFRVDIDRDFIVYLFIKNDRNGLQPPATGLDHYSRSRAAPDFGDLLEGRIDAGRQSLYERSHTVLSSSSFLPAKVSRSARPRKEIPTGCDAGLHAGIIPPTP